MSEPTFSDFNDEELYALLRKHQFRGPTWDHYVEALVKSVWRVLSGLILSKKIFSEMRRRHYSCCGPVVIDRQGAEDIAEDMIATAIEPYRRMLADRWNPHGAANLKSAFIGECLRQFPNQYRRWLRANLGRDGEKILALPGDDLVAQLSDAHARADPVDALIGDPAELVTNRHHLQELLALFPDNLRAVLQLVAAGYTFRQAAVAHGLDDKRLRKELYRIRPEMRKQWAERDTEPHS